MAEPDTVNTSNSDMVFPVLAYWPLIASCNSEMRLLMNMRLA
jgi:hypothetical protein